MAPETASSLADSNDRTSLAPASGDSSQLVQLYQLRTMYELVTSITSHCFDACIPRINPRTEEAEKNCLSNCAANFMHMKLMLTRRLVETIKSNQEH